jgi:hypothetical protein
MDDSLSFRILKLELTIKFLFFIIQFYSDRFANIQTVIMQFINKLVSVVIYF